MFNDKSQREKWKDMTAIFSPWFVVVLTVGAGFWWQMVTAHRNENAKRLELAVSILQQEPKKDDSGKELRDWALQEFLKQTGTLGTPAITAELDSLKNDPGVFRSYQSDRFGTAAKPLPGDNMPNMQVPKEFETEPPKGK